MTQSIGKVRVDVMIHADRNYCASAPGTRLGEPVCVYAFWSELDNALQDVLMCVAPVVAEIPAAQYPYIVISQH